METRESMIQLLRTLFEAAITAYAGISKQRAAKECLIPVIVPLPENWGEDFSHALTVAMNTYRALGWNVAYKKVSIKDRLIAREEVGEVLIVHFY